MQTFIPAKSFEEIASILDYKRLGKQRVEAWQILHAIEHTNGWSHHPVVKMWTGYENALKAYFNVISKEWVRRGYKHNLGFFPDNPYLLPEWWEREDIHSSHRAALLFKDFNYYSKFGWKEKPKLHYVWVK